MKKTGYGINVDTREVNSIFEYDHKILKWDNQRKVFKLNIDLLDHEDADALADVLSKKESFYLKNPDTIGIAKVTAVMDETGRLPEWLWYVHHPDNGKERWPIVMDTGLESRY